jgi:rSAM/selenodomain-associated transferase 1
MDVLPEQVAAVKEVFFNHNCMSTDTLLIIFTRNPVLGQVKTRLAMRIGPEKALEIYQILLEKTAAVTKAVHVDKWVYTTPMILEDGPWNTCSFDIKSQKGKDLGQRMMNAFVDAFDAGYKRVVLIGSDLFELTPEDLVMAFEKLSDHRAVIGPAEDGGYYLIGLKAMHSGLFENKNWGTNTVLRDTLAHFKSHDVALLNQYNDIDTYEDLEQHLVFQKYLNH